MAKTPTYKELEQSVKELEIEALDCKQAEKALRESEGKLGAMLQSIGDHMSMMDKDLNLIWVNKLAKNVFGNDIVGKKCYEVYHQRKDPCQPYPCLTLKAFQDGKVHEHDTQVIDKHGKIIWFHCTANVALRDKQDKPIGVLEISRDISKRKQAEQALKKRERELEIKNENLEEAIAAQKALLKRRDEDKGELEEKVLSNVKELVEPYLEKLKKSGLDERQQAYASILESNLDEIVSPFCHSLSSKYLSLTPAEIQVANLVKAGRTAKEIAGLLNLSVNTVEFHRANIRRKIGIKNTKANLRSHLLSLQ